MNKLTQTLLTGSALCGLVTAPAVAQPTHPAMHVMALHAGHAVNKTKFHIPGRQHVTYTFGVYTEKTANARKTDLLGTFYRWNDTTGGHYTTVCSRPKQHLKVPKNSIYARVDPGTETYSFGCPSGPTVFYGDVWTNKTGVPGDVDTFRSSLLGRPSG
ncbi:MAG TPA: hypothetical protein VHW69_16015, partial [Rhizomicrobium sp.]|nr:hypothetical protein [Rhizomicrobium sp.]